MYTGSEYFTQIAVPKTADRVLELILAPVANPDMFWLVIPLIIVTFFMTLYFGRYKYEELGWNTATSNSLVLLFISIDLLRYIYYSVDSGSMQSYALYPTESLISLAILAISLLMITANYHHKIRKNVAFFVSSPITINTIAYVVMAVVYSLIPPDTTTFFAGIVLFIIVFCFLKLIQFIQSIIIKYNEIERAELGRETISEDAILELEEELAEKKAELAKAKLEMKKIEERAVKLKEKQLKTKREKERKFKDYDKKMVIKAKIMGRAVGIEEKKVREKLRRLREELGE